MTKFILPAIILLSVFGFFATIADVIYTPYPVCGFMQPGSCSRSEYFYEQLQFYIPLAPLWGLGGLGSIFSNKNGGIAEFSIKIIGLVLGYAAARVTYHYSRKWF
jgi:hypothetical protein